MFEEFRLIFIGFGAVVILGLLVTVYFKGKAECEAVQQKQEIREVVIHDKIENNIIKLSDHDLDGRFTKWLRNE